MVKPFSRVNCKRHIRCWIGRALSVKDAELKLRKSPRDSAKAPESTRKAALCSSNRIIDLS